jgi:hypothetical protein
VRLEGGLREKNGEKTFPRGVEKLVAQRAQGEPCHEKVDYFRDSADRNNLCMSDAAVLRGFE